MTDPLYVQPDGVRSYAQIHDGVVGALSQLLGTAAPEALGVESTHGPIASAVSGALSQVLDRRHGTLQATSTSAQTISELLQKAAQMYEHGDQKGAATLRAAAEAIQDANASGAAGAAGSTGAAGAAGAGSAGAGGGAEMVGQMVSQVGQQLGQTAQSIAQPLQGMAQGLQQIPQQVMQGAQQLAQQVSQAAGSSVVLELREDACLLTREPIRRKRCIGFCRRCPRRVVEQSLQARTPRVAAGTHAQVLLFGD